MCSSGPYHRWGTYMLHWYLFLRFFRYYWNRSPTLFIYAYVSLFSTLHKWKIWALQDGTAVIVGGKTNHNSTHWRSSRAAVLHPKLCFRSRNQHIGRAVDCFYMCSYQHITSDRMVSRAGANSKLLSCMYLFIFVQLFLLQLSNLRYTL